MKTFVIKKAVLEDIIMASTFRAHVKHYAINSLDFCLSAIFSGKEHVSYSEIEGWPPTLNSALHSGYALAVGVIGDHCQELGLGQVNWIICRKTPVAGGYFVPSRKYLQTLNMTPFALHEKRKKMLEKIKKSTIQII